MLNPIPEGTDMHSTACLEWIRRWRASRSLVALVVWCSISLIAAPGISVAQGKPDSADQPKGARSKDKSAVYIVDEKECKAKADDRPEWSAPEKWAWEQLCKHVNVDFDEKEANDIADKKVGKASPERDGLYLQTLKDIQARNAKAPETPANDYARRLSGSFLAQIFGDADLRQNTWNAPLRLYGFNTDRFVIDNAALKSLDIRNAHVKQFLIQNTSIDGGLRLEHVRLSSIKVRLVTAKHFLLNKVSVVATNVELADLGPSLPSFQPEQDEKDGILDIDTARFEDRLAILEGSYDAIDLKRIKVDDLLIRHPAWNNRRDEKTPELSITESVDNGIFTLELTRDASPKQIKLNQFIFANAYLGSDPKPVITAMDAYASSGANGHPDLEPYTLIAKSYAERGETGISDDVLIAKNHQDWHLAKKTEPLSLEFIWLTLTWLVAGYGFRPERGFLWIAGFVLLGWLIFRRASDRLAADSYKPRSAFLLAVDSVIPGIQLDKNHLDVRYEGWPQIMLYLLRILGAVLVFIAFFYLQKKLLG
jgi:hypothetical protein